MKKLIQRIILAIVILVVVAVALVWIMINPIAKAAVEKGSGKALGVEANLDSISLGLLSGSVELRGFNMGNPKEGGYASPYLVDLGEFNVAVEPGSLLTDTVHITKFQIDELVMNIEWKDVLRSNINDIMANIKGTKTQEKEGTGGKGKKVEADIIQVKNITANFYVPGKKDPIPVRVPIIELKDFKSDESGSVAGELAMQLLPAIMMSALDNAKGLIPTDLLQGLNTSVMDVAGMLDTELLGQIKPLGDLMGDTLKDVKIDESIKIKEPAEDVGKALDKGIKDIGGGLFGDKKE